MAQIVTKGRHKMGVLLQPDVMKPRQYKRYSRGFQPRELGAFIRYRKDITNEHRAELLRLYLGASCGAVAVGHNR